MTITLMAKEWDELWEEAAQHTPHHPPALEPFIEFCELPKQLGKGYVQWMELYLGLELLISYSEFQEQVQFKQPESDHPLQFGVLLSGIVPDSYGGQCGGGNTMISGSGVQPAIASEFSKAQPYVGINIDMPPDLLATFFPDENEQIPPELGLLVKGNDWQTLLYPTSNLLIQRVAQQIINCPYQGIAKRIYLQAKVVELMALQLRTILPDQGTRSSSRLKSQTIAQIHYAKEILLANLENPPSSLELAQRVGLSDVFDKPLNAKR